MAPTKVTDADLQAYLDAGHSQADAARYFRVSEAAIYQRLKRMGRLTTRLVALERANDVVDDKLSATARLERALDQEKSRSRPEPSEPGVEPRSWIRLLPLALVRFSPGTDAAAAAKPHGRVRAQRIALAVSQAAKSDNLPHGRLVYCGYVPYCRYVRYCRYAYE
jgi:hypothetical protein